MSEMYRSRKEIVTRVMLVILVSCMIFVLLSSILFTRRMNMKRPHIIFIIADDLGWNDVSFHGSPEIPTPNIDALAASGIILNKHYVAPQCSPSRASLLTGKYPSSTGLQHLVIKSGQPSALPLNFTLMPQYLKKMDYATHLVGKWHLGYYKKEYTPTYRGFDSFYGYWNGKLDYFDHTNYGSEDFWGIDLHNGTETVRGFRGKYVTELFSDEAERIIKDHNASQPLFLMLSHLAPHTGNPYQPQQALPRHVKNLSHIKDFNRRKHAGMISALDESVGNVFSALDVKGILDDSIIIFMSDNGATPEGQDGGHGSNWPLKGSKFTLFEGGVRVPTIIWSPLLQLKESTTSLHLMHISDWLPTLYAAAGGDVKDLGEIDGLNMWESLRSKSPSPRHEILLNVDSIYGMSSLILEHLKLVNGSYSDDNRDLWYGPSGKDDFTVSSMDEWVWRNGSVVKDILQRTGKWLLSKPNDWRENAVFECGSNIPDFGNANCDPYSFPCLFNITEDPCEYHNLASQYPQMITYMMDRISQLSASSLKPIYNERDLRADPRCHEFSYVSWLDEERTSECY